MQAFSTASNSATRPAAGGLVRVRTGSHSLCVVRVRRNVRVNFREGSKQDQTSSKSNR
jgi:hypothetical protein